MRPRPAGPTGAGLRLSATHPRHVAPGVGREVGAWSGLATVTCPHGGSVTVAGSIAGNVQALLNAAANDGVSLYKERAAQPGEADRAQARTAVPRTTPSTTCPSP